MTKNTTYPDTSAPEIVEPRANTAPEFGETIVEFGGTRLFALPRQPRWTHRIYGRAKGEKRYYAIDVKNGRQVVNLIYATCFDETEAHRVAAKMREQNPEHEFQVRKISSAPS